MLPFLRRYVTCSRNALASKIGRVVKGTDGVRLSHFAAKGNNIIRLQGSNGRVLRQIEIDGTCCSMPCAIAVCRHLGSEAIGFCSFDRIVLYPCLEGMWLVQPFDFRVAQQPLVRKQEDNRYQWHQQHHKRPCTKPRDNLTIPIHFVFY